MRSSPLALLALALAACSSDPAPGGAPADSAVDVPPADGGGGTDTSSPRDAGTDRGAPHDIAASDTGPAIDTGEAPDVVTADVGAVIDAEVVIDAASAVDTGPPVDTGPRVDVVAAVDTGPRIDVPTPVDTGPRVDVVAAVDTGPRVDVVTLVDTGPRIDVVAAVDTGVRPDVPVLVDTGPDVPPRIDAGPALVDAGVVPRVTGLPRIDAALKATLREVFARGQAAGMRANVFAKVGDSITSSESFLVDFGPTAGPSFNLGAYTALDPTRVFFGATLVTDRHSSFDRESVAALTGWTTADALVGDGMIIRQEIAALRPAVAIVMLGSADVEVTELGAYRSNLTRIGQILLAGGTIPVLSTIPDRTDNPSNTERFPAFNTAIREVAAALRVPLADYALALAPLPRHGVSDDGVHPSVYRSPAGRNEAAYFTGEALAFGYNVRNLLALATLAHLRAVVFADGAPDP
ncbi:MAG: SGNH/GDSL hydrolase family protein [Deltaproteobacteria bacterium]|nr:SGNH/GDSL hydrolase family protein [Deltaproteobacteria bacterium]